MREFFKPWRKRIGVVVLVLACVAMVGWVRSFSILDEVGIQRENSYHRIVSMCGGIVWIIDQPKPMKGMHHGRLWTFITKQFSRYPTLDGWEIDLPPDKDNQRFTWAGFAYRNSQSPGQLLTVYIIPYWSIVILPTALSAYLLLSKPRSKPPTNPTPA